jgi:hypothetical protein
VANFAPIAAIELVGLVQTAIQLLFFSRCRVDMRIFGLAMVIVVFGLTLCAPVFEYFWVETHNTWKPPSMSVPLSDDEIHRLAAVRAMEDYCSIGTDLTEKGENIRLRFDQTKSEALKEAEESFRGEDCNKMLVRFYDIMQRWDK